jgi:hypothetical protein
MASNRPEPVNVGACLLPKPHDYVHDWLQSDSFRHTKVIGPKVLSDTQVTEGVNAILTRFLGHPGRPGATAPPQRSFLLGDPRGENRTNQFLLSAHLMAEKTGLFSLVVTFDEDVLRLREALSHFGLSPEQQLAIRVHSYNEFPAIVRRAIEIDKGFGMTAFNEAHILVKEERRIHNALVDLPSKHWLFATSTPFVDQEGTLFFLSRLQNRKESSVYSDLVPRNSMWDHRGLFSNIESARDCLLSTGALLRREVPLWGEVKPVLCELSPDESRQQDGILDYFDKQLRRSLIDVNTLLHRQRIAELVHLTHRVKVEQTVQLAKDEVAAGRKVIVFGMDWIVQYQSRVGMVSGGFMHDLTVALDKEKIPFGRLEKYSPGLGKPWPEEIRMRNYHAVYSFLNQPDPEYARRYQFEPSKPCDILIIPSSLTNHSQRLYHEAGQDKPRTIIDATMLRGGMMVEKINGLNRQKAVSPVNYHPIICVNSFADEVAILPHTLVDLQYLKAMGSRMAAQLEPAIESALFGNRYLQTLAIEVAEGQRPVLDHHAQRILSIYGNPKPYLHAGCGR